MEIDRSAARILAILSIASALPIMAHGQEAQRDRSDGEVSAAGALDEIIVTARRRSESLQDVPISIVSRSGEYLELSQVESLTELDRVVPGFVFKEYEGGGQSTMAIRGLSTFAESGAQQSVGLVVDGVVHEAIGTAVTSFNDVERIEVLRGPQGTLFGKNTTGGVVHIITKDPTDDFEGGFSASYGSYDEVRWSGTISGPLFEDVAARASVFTVNREGHVENIFDGRMLGNDEQVGIRTKLLFTPGDDTRLLLTYHHIERSQEGASSGGGSPVIGFGPASTETQIEVNAEIAGPENDRVNGIGYQPFEDRIDGVTLTWDQAFGEYAFTSITAWEYWHWDFGEDKKFRAFNAPVQPLFFEEFFAGTRQNAWSQEFRLASPGDRTVEYVVGAFTSASDGDGPLDFLFNLADDPDPAAAIYLFDDEMTERRNFNYAVFGEADIHVADAFTVTAGLRWTHDETDVTTDSLPPPGYVPELGLGFGPLGELYIPFLGSGFPGLREGSVSADDWSWRLGLQWEPSDRSMFYTSAARGFKGPTISAVSGEFANVDPEIANSIEIGTKLSFLDNRLLAQLTVFRVDVHDFQAQGTDNIETPDGTIPAIILKNAGEVRSQGVEFSLSAVPTEQLAIDVGLAYIDAKYIEFIGASCYAGQTAEEGCLPVDPADPALEAQDLSGKRLPFTPELSGTASINYDFSLPRWSASQFIRLDYTYQSEVNWNLGLAPLNETDPIGVFGLSLGVRSPSKEFQVIGYIKNLTDEYVVNGLGGGNEATTAYLQPDYQRTYGIQFSYTYE